ncbi:hypothetical protein PT285_04410 [Lactobacillus sp. ESL0791]|uniref:hypothetical protein n=1 Tax=Lactobacillus sp. ESL0791 TaxID=2983234 RepID=UPI0023F8B0FD|nr:hypothetical protein [Lactobacillus sp. ESL0791]MDF7638642.1 hypothetical protein [Lactobacillus sp. ESL0791]
MAGKNNENVVIAQFFANMYDAQRDCTLEDVDIVAITKKLYESVAKFDVELRVLINFKNKTTPPPLEKLVSVDFFRHYPNNKFYFLRWEVTLNYLLQHPEIKKAALVDAGDVEMLNYPFDDVQEDTIYVGDEFVDLTGSIIVHDSKPAYLADFVAKNRHLQLLNTGILVGTREILVEYLAILMKLVVEDAKNEKFHPEEAHLGSFEMALTCYVLYKFFKGRICSGRKVSTHYRYFEHQSSAWFKHK